MEPKSGLEQDLISSLQEKLEIAHDAIDSLETGLGLLEGVEKELEVAQARIKDSEYKRQYNMDAINHLAATMGMLGETSEDVIEFAIQRMTDFEVLKNKIQSLESKLALANEALEAVAGEGPYYNEEGDCAYCSIEAEDDEIPSDPEKHMPNCGWAKARKAIAAMKSEPEDKP